MKLNELQAKLIAAARLDTPKDNVPYAFEQRIMHRLAARRPESPWVWWNASLWRGAVACMAITAACAIWFSQAPKTPEPTADLSQELQSTVFASMNQPTEDAW